jgi:1-aminocyclopropane-1-carboxylate deaminase/D-cysteine desulfhydrase-like pyridoxal-dependent ACC family enzyme
MFLLPSPVEEHVFEGFRFQIKRDDLIHPEVSGNKWRKLRLNIDAARKQGCDTLLTFGGAFSNHIAATAAAGRLLKLNTIGVIRGEAQYAGNPTLRKARAEGMKLHFLDRSSYKMLRENGFYTPFRETYPGAFIIPEGGANLLGAQGCSDFWRELSELPEHVVLAGGTGTTAAGLLLQCPPKTAVHLVPVLKGGVYLKSVVEDLLNTADCLPGQMQHLQIHDEFHFGGYAKATPVLWEFKRNFEEATGVLLDQVYTAKAAFGMVQLMRQGHLPADGKTLFIHTGGLQGNKKSAP